MDALALARPAQRRLPRLDALRRLTPRLGAAAPRPAAPTPRALDLLRSERVLWLTTRDRESGAHVVPMPFTWDGEAIWVFAKPGQRKLQNLARDSRAMLAVGSADGDLDVQLIEARGEILAGEAGAVAPLAAHLARHRSAIEAAGLDAERYVSRYPQAIRLVPTRYLPWRGRG